MVSSQVIFTVAFMVAERSLFLPSLGICIVVTDLVDALLASPPPCPSRHGSHRYASVFLPCIRCLVAEGNRYMRGYRRARCSVGCRRVALTTVLAAAIALYVPLRGREFSVLASRLLRTASRCCARIHTANQTWADGEALGANVLRHYPMNPNHLLVAVSVHLTIANTSRCGTVYLHPLSQCL